MNLNHSGHTHHTFRILSRFLPIFGRLSNSPQIKIAIIHVSDAYLDVQRRNPKWLMAIWKNVLDEWDIP